MYLDAYYKLLFYDVLTAYKYMNETGTYSTGTLTIPGIYNTSGTQRTTLFCANWSAVSAFGNIYKGILSQTSTAASPVNRTYGQMNLIVGSGTTPVAASDYKVESEITNNLSCLSINKSHSAEDGFICWLKTMQNTGASDITINEIGLTAPMNSASSTYNQILIYREVLETPLVVAPGESFTVSIRMDFPMPG